MESTIRVLDPTAAATRQAERVAAPLASLGGAVLGLRIDPTWPSFATFCAEIEMIARSAWGVRDVLRWQVGGRDRLGAAERARAAEFARGVQAAVVGLGT